MENFQSTRESKIGNPENNPILQAFSRVVARAPGDPAVLLADGSVARTFRVLDEAANHWAGRLRSAPAGTVGLLLGNDPSWPEILVGAWRAGRCVVPLEPGLPDGLRGRMEDLCGVTLRVTPSGMEETGRRALPVCADLLKLTSGTTGAPRAIRFSAEALRADCDAVCETMGLTVSDRNYGVVSFAHSYGFSNLITPLLCRGLSLVAASDALPQAMRDGLLATRATVLPGAPAHFRALGAAPCEGHGLRLCISAGAPLTPEVAAAFFSSWKIKVHTFYGASECGGICYDGGSEPVRSPGFVGRPMRGVTIAPHASNSGRVVIHSGAVGLGYFPEPDLTLDAGFFSPADLLTRTAEGWWITGRESDVINVAGRKVNPVEIEIFLRRCPGVEDCVVLGLPAPLQGETVAACVVGVATEAALRSACTAALAPWQVPRRWRFLPEIPTTLRGKVSRGDLRRLFVEERGSGIPD